MKNSLAKELRCKSCSKLLGRVKNGLISVSNTQEIPLKKTDITVEIKCKSCSEVTEFEF